MSGTDLPKISDEMVDAYRRAAEEECGSALCACEDSLRAGLAAALVASGRVFQDVRSAQAAAVRGAGAGIRQAMGRTGVLLDGVQIAQMLDGIARQIDGGDREAGLEQAQPLLADGSGVESLELVESPEGQERSEEPEHG